MDLMMEVELAIREKEALNEVPGFQKNKEKRDRILKVLKSIEESQYTWGEPHWREIAKGEWIEAVRKILDEQIQAKEG